MKARSSWRLNSVRCRWIFTDSQCVWNLFHVSFLEPRIFKWILDFFLEHLFAPSLVQVHFVPCHQSVERLDIEVRG